MAITTKQKFYCKNCNTYLEQTEVKLVFSADMTQRRYLCPTCQNRLYWICSTCYKGKMLKPEMPVSGDYNQEGKLEDFCTTCGCGFIQNTTGRQINIDVFFISKRNIKILIDKIFTRQNLPYNQKTEVENHIFLECKTRDDIVTRLSKDFNESQTFLEKELQGRYTNF